ncbi:MAG: elongation factor P maturation arginine rhamnosyltransferase EarP [Alcaligenaceae bacterium]|nr:elongation factor P maturation arginine rhamnosyltransferase EarP [Alcaligenaceae bacterium]
MNLKTSTIDIFCRVIDNFGDIGVCWRLARSFPSSYTIRLWVDDLNSFNKIEPSLNPNLSQQILAHIEIRHWHDELTDWQAADLVIEAFGCDLPHRYLEAMKDNTTCWLNLEYLSAEHWVEDFHLQPSLQPNGVAKYFFFPGFTEKTGGLLRLQRLVKNSQTPAHFLKKLLPPEAYDYYQEKKPRLINLFCYPHAPVDALLKALPDDQEMMIIVAQTVAPQLEQQAAALNSSVYIQRLNFIVQADYDLLLQIADINLIRGEDSFVQAHWAAKPMLWHIYPQDEAQHMVKLAAWLQAIQAPQWLRELNRLWCSAETNDLNSNQKQALSKLFRRYAFDPVSNIEWQEFQTNLCKKLGQQATLSQQILNFYEDCAKKS